MKEPVVVVLEESTTGTSLENYVEEVHHEEDSMEEGHNMVQPSRVSTSEMIKVRKSISEGLGDTIKLAIGKIGSIETVQVTHQVQVGNGNIYAPTDAREKVEMFVELMGKVRESDLPWLLGSDFNSVLKMEKRLGATADDRDIEFFQQVVNELGLIDLPLKGDSPSIKEAAAIHFESLYGQRRVLELQNWDIDFHKVPEHLANGLEIMFIEDEVKEAIFSCDGNKA
ncbi:Uncharacterized protein TCM_024471 [Theobroma cacao]|uniref:Endonuclease/exonuclease/phosphatase domain-containing protein n=1 Tax=Theobroma cacao TaxID=3641 RepID=A0A061F3J4_THECC|nr:Uncharacterized protein TCM_024471 [Theobroma cacao]